MINLELNKYYKAYNMIIKITEIHSNFYEYEVIKDSEQYAVAPYMVIPTSFERDSQFHHEIEELSDLDKMKLL